MPIRNISRVVIESHSMRFYGNAFGNLVVIREREDENGCDKFDRGIFGYFIVKVPEVYLESRDFFNVLSVSSYIYAYVCSVQCQIVTVEGPQTNLHCFNTL
jgi:hypothetical protein